MSLEISALRERAKELRCLYQVQDALADRSQTPPKVFVRVLEAMPAGWQRPSSTGARIQYLGRSYVGPGYLREGVRLRSPIRLGTSDVGLIEVVDSSEGAEFLVEERELLSAIASRLSEYLEWKHTQLLADYLPAPSEHWRWREHYALALVAQLDRARFGVSRVLLGGSTGSGDAGAGSDIDLYVDFHGTAAQRAELTVWIEGWSLCLTELATQQTGYRVAGGLIDLHWIDASTDPRTLHDLRELKP